MARRVVGSRHAPKTVLLVDLDRVLAPWLQLAPREQPDVEGRVGEGHGRVIELA